MRRLPLKIYLPMKKIFSWKVRDAAEAGAGGHGHATGTQGESLPRLRSEGEGIVRPAAGWGRALRVFAGGLRLALCRGPRL